MSRRNLGSIHERKSKTTGKTTFVASLEIGRTPNGNRIRPTRSASTRTEANRLLKEMISQHQAGLLTIKQNDTVETLGLYWVREVKTLQVRTSTATDYESRLRREIFPYLGNKRIQDLTGRDIEKWMRTLKHQGKSVNTINGARRILYQLCKYATRQELVFINPVTKTDPLKADPKNTQVKKPWTKEETATALKAAIGTDLDLYLHLALYTGMRRGEILGLQWHDINFEAGTITIVRTLKEQRHLNGEGIGTIQLTTNDPKTLSGFRTLTLSSPLVSAFIRYQEHQQKLRETAGANWVETEYVITANNGKAMYPSNVRNRYLKFVKTNNLRFIRLHDMRHTAAHLSLESNVRLEAVSQGLGHSRIEITKNIYARHVPKLALEFSEGLAEAISPTDEAINQLLQTPPQPGQENHAKTTR
jgi:integrase